MYLTVDPYEHLLKMPTPVRPVAPVYVPPPDLASEHRSNPIPPVPQRLVADVDARFEQNVFNLAQRQRIADVQHHREANDLGRTVEITQGISHRLRLRNSPSPLKPIYSDNAPPRPTAYAPSTARAFCANATTPLPNAYGNLPTEPRRSSPAAHSWRQARYSGPTERNIPPTHEHRLPLSTDPQPDPKPTGPGKRDF